MTERGYASWSTVIGGSSQNGMLKEALALFREMQKSMASPWLAFRGSLKDKAQQLTGDLTIGLNLEPTTSLMSSTGKVQSEG
ncbi:hypothetical protein EJ110_NYTH22663 [Nymphaea thermarum]|nr:hypothetical protein EJ110_NYTH22663 [Nymphaea thermarum]